MYCFPLVGPSLERSGLALVCYWVVYIGQPQDRAHESPSPLYPCSWRAFCGEGKHIRYPHWGCAWAVWSTSCIFCSQVVSHREQLSSDWLWTLSYLSSMSMVVFPPAWGRVSSGLHRSQGAGAYVYLATVEPPLDMLDREASWVHTWTYSTLLALPTLLLMDSCDYLLQLSCSLSLILPCTSLWLTSWHWVLRI